MDIVSTQSAVPRIEPPEVVRLSSWGYAAPELWTNVNGNSYFSFAFEVDMGALMVRAGVVDFTPFQAFIPLSLHDRPETDPLIIYNRTFVRIDTYVNGALQRICGGAINGKGGLMRDIDGSNSWLNFRVNIPAPYARAMASLFEADGLAVSVREGFIEPQQNLPLGSGTHSSTHHVPQNLAEFVQELSSMAIAAVDLRNELIVQTPAEWGPIGDILGALAKEVFEQESSAARNFKERSD